MTYEVLLAPVLLTTVSADHTASCMDLSDVAGNVKGAAKLFATGVAPVSQPILHLNGVMGSDVVTKGLFVCIHRTANITHIHLSQST